MYGIGMKGLLIYSTKAMSLITRNITYILLETACQVLIPPLIG